MNRWKGLPEGSGRSVVQFGVWGLVGRILGGPMTLPLGVTYLILYTAVSRKIMFCSKRDFAAVIMAINQLILRWENFLCG